MVSIAWLSVGLFVVGLVEYTIDQYQKLLLSRLKFWSTIGFQLVNKTFEMAINLYIFGTIVVFWEKFLKGNHDFYLLSPYAAYTLGTVAGTGLALHVFTWLKKRKERERLSLMPKPTRKNKKQAKKKYKKLVSDTVNKMSDDTLLDPIETEDLKEQIKAHVVENVTQKITEKVDAALNQESDS